MLSPNDQKNVFVVIPAYNEQESITKVLNELSSLPYNIIVVDDGSTPPLEGLLKNTPVHLLKHRVNLGQGAALQTGIEFALSKNADFIVTYDADGQHRAADIETLLWPLRQHQTDITLGSRFISNTSQLPPGRRSVLKLARYINFFFTGLLLSDAHNGLRALTSKAAQQIRLRQNGMAHATEIIAEIKKHRLKFTEVPVTIHYTDYSKKKGQTVWSSFRIFFDILLNKLFK
ncbi:MAG TPA: glycosyltransferase family 2 protein [Chitinophagaceae bacterium]|nr:glycosyltransferase family 2 protein [Chitinophagaceae bacterium]